MYKSYIYFAKFILKYFILFNNIINAIFKKNSVSNYLLLKYKHNRFLITELT